MKNHGSSFHDKLTWAAHSGIPILLAVVLLAGAAWLALPRWAKPPVLRVEGVLYIAPSTYTLESQEDLAYLGDVASAVSSRKSPKKDFQANHDITGAAVYRRPDGNLAVLEHDGHWYVYRVLE